MLLDEIEHRGDHALYAGGAGPQPQRDLLQLPALAEVRDRGLGLAAVRVGVVEPAVLRGEEFAGGHELLLREQRRHQPRQRAAALVELDRRRAPRGERAGRLAARETESARHRVGIESEQASHGRRRAEGADDAGTVPAAGARRGEIPAEPDARRRLAAGGERDQQVAPGKPVALGDRQRGRHDFRRDVRNGGAVHVAHRDGGDEVAVQHGRAGERQPVAADDARFLRLRQRRGQRGDLVRLLAPVAGDRARERVEQQVLGVLPRGRRNLLVVERRRELRELLRDFTCHGDPPRDCSIDAEIANARSAAHSIIRCTLANSTMPRYGLMPEYCRMTIDIASLKAWIGRQETAGDTLAAFPAAALTATLDRDDTLRRGRPAAAAVALALPPGAAQDLGAGGQRPRQARRLHAAGAAAAAHVGRRTIHLRAPVADRPGGRARVHGRRPHGEAGRERRPGVSAVAPRVLRP